MRAGATIILTTTRLVVRSWVDTDRDLFREINADPEVMEFFPFRRTDAEADALRTTINETINRTGLGFYCLELRGTAEPIGFCGLSYPNLPGVFPEGTVEIGWRLARRFWGSGYASEAARALLDLAFTRKGFAEVVSFAVAANERSTAVMRRLGMRPAPERDFDHPRVPDSHPHLKRHVVYVIIREDFRRPDDTHDAYPSIGQP